MGWWHALGALAIVAAPADQEAGNAADPILADIAQARAFSSQQGERLWPGFGTAPFGFLLILPEREILLCRDGGADGFTAHGTDLATNCPRHERARSGLPDNWLAAMPLFGPPATIVMGTPATTGRPRAAWLHTVLHEHFHQWQSSQPDYYARVEALDLAGGDTTGMWMLNFPFPYEDRAAGAAHAAASRALADAVAARGTPRFRRALSAYLAARRGYAAAVGERNWRYLEFQLWQEGGARWTEIALGKTYPDAAVRESAARLEAGVVAQLRSPDLARDGREMAYAYGAAEAMLLDACGPAWRRAYPTQLALGPLLDAAQRRCRTRR